MKPEIPDARHIIAVEHGDVVLRLTPPEADQLATVINTAVLERDDWMKDVVPLMESAANRLGYSSALTQARPDLSAAASPTDRDQDVNAGVPGP